MGHERTGTRREQETRSAQERCRPFFGVATPAASVDSIRSRAPRDGQGGRLLLTEMPRCPGRPLFFSSVGIGLLPRDNPRGVSLVSTRIGSDRWFAGIHLSVPTSIHLMGEDTVTNAAVRLLQAIFTSDHACRSVAMNSRPSEIGLTPPGISRRLKAWSLASSSAFHGFAKGKNQQKIIRNANEFVAADPGKLERVSDRLDRSCEGLSGAKAPPDVGTR